MINKNKILLSFVLLKIYLFLYNYFNIKIINIDLSINHIFTFFAFVLPLSLLFLLLYKIDKLNKYLFSFLILCILLDFYLIFSTFLNDVFLLFNYKLRIRQNIIISFSLLFISFFLIQKNKIIKSFIHKINQIITYSLSILIFISFFQILNAKDFDFSDIELKKISNNNKFNLIFIILDEHTSYELINSKNNENLSLPKLAKDNLFSIKNSHSYSDKTIHSLFNILNIGHTKNINEKTPFIHILEAINKNNLTNLFISNNFNFLNYSIYKINNVYSLDELPEFYLIPIIYSTFYNYIFTSIFLYQNYFNIDISTKDKKYLENLPIKKSIKRKLEGFNNFSKDSMNKNIFGYFHFLIPHSPYCFDTLGEINKNYGRYFKDYINNVKYSKVVYNELLTTFFNSSKAKNTILIIQGDHGTRAADIKLTDLERREILNLVYLPDKNYSIFKDSMSNTNTLITILNKYFDQNIPLMRKEY